VSEDSTNGIRPFARRDEILELREQLDELRTEHRKLEIRLAEYQDLINRNPSTGLPIRRLFEASLSEALDDHRQGDRVPRLAVGLLRLDGSYARIKNSRDRSRVLLFKTADRIREVLGDNVFQSDRLDEFLLILRGMPNFDGVELRADQVVEAVARFHEPPADDVRFGCFLGVSVFPDHGTTREELLGNADIALTESERIGAPFVIYNGEMGVQYREREYIETELKAAIQAGFDGLRLHYQPLVDAAGRIRGSEALIRWTHPELGNVSPGRFIPIAEEIGSVRFIGQWSLYRACRQLKSWHEAGHGELYVSVNLSPSQFTQIDLVERIAGVLESVHLPGRFLTLELTETAIMEKPEEAIAKMQDLRSMNVRLALDDFGTGYSSLSYLHRFQFDTLKIDRSFIANVHENRNDQEIVRAMVAMARAFGMQTLAEGVERREELDFLLENGCDMVQGYYYSPAVDREAFLTLANNGFGRR
jgi:c-di-GMP phosphodiesterase